MNIFEENENVYIARTKAFFDDEQDWIFTPKMWKYGWTPTDEEFAGEVYLLTDEGKHILDWWLTCRRMNEYQYKNCFGYDSTSSEDLFYKLTMNKDYALRPAVHE